MADTTLNEKPARKKEEDESMKQVREPFEQLPTTISNQISNVSDSKHLCSIQKENQF
jgi:hypothetical protein